MIKILSNLSRITSFGRTLIGLAVAIAVFFFLRSVLIDWHYNKYVNPVVVVKVEQATKPLLFSIDSLTTAAIESGQNLTIATGQISELQLIIQTINGQKKTTESKLQSAVQQNKKLKDMDKVDLLIIRKKIFKDDSTFVNWWER
jgi:hypothetical protein